MSLPSKYSREGLSYQDQHRIITTGSHQQKTGPATYNVRLALPNFKASVESDDLYDDERLMASLQNQKGGISSKSSHLHQVNHLHETPPNHTKHVETDLKQALQYLVIDTNFILSHLRILVTLMEICAQYLQIVIIPTEVIRELDGLKSSLKIETNVGSGNSTIGQLARRANDWIYYCLAEGKLTVRGQAEHEKIDPILTNDEAILDCCVYFRSLFPKALTVLLSNDKNLCVKALSSLIPTVSYREGMSANKIAKAIYTEYETRFRATENAMAADSMVVDSIEVDLEENLLDDKYLVEDPGANNDVTEDIIEVDMVEPGLSLIIETSQSSPPLLDPAVACVNVHKEIKKLVISIVKKAIFFEYGDDTALLRDYDETVITTLYMAAKTLVRFWSQVFEHLLPGCRPFVTIANNREPIMFETPENADQVRKFIDFWYQILHLLYEKLMTLDQLEALYLLKRRWDELANF